VWYSQVKLIEEIEMQPKNQLNAYMNTRVSQSTKTMFQHKAQRFGKPSDVLRELILAFVDDRLVVKSNPTKESLYHVNQ